MTLRASSSVLLLACCAIASGCATRTPPATINGKPPLIGGFMSPQPARIACVDAVVREFKVPRGGVKPTSDMQALQDGIYVVTLDVGDGRPTVNCTVNENGNVSDVVRAR